MCIRSYGVEKNERFVPGAKMSVEDISGNINISCSLIGQKEFKLGLLIYLGRKHLSHFIAHGIIRWIITFSNK